MYVYIYIYCSKIFAAISCCNTSEGVPVFEASGVRPLNVTNADNRLIASAVRIELEPLIGPLITTDQRGFLTGRSMLANLLDVDEPMMETACRSERGMAFFFDFAAAFPSIEHDFFIGFFQHLGWPPCLINIIRILYQDNWCSICLSGTRYEGFSITRGIRQGCPLSPLLFAMSTDLLLRRLHRLFPSSCARAWADDLAMVIPEVQHHWCLLLETFCDFALVSGLQLNISKTVAVPLYQYVEQQVRDDISRVARGWGEISIAHTAKYLGFYVGPGKGQLSWKAPLQKFRDRAKQWGRMGLGFLLTVQAYQIYISSVLQFVLQLEPLPDDFEAEERWAVQSLFPGPTAWMLPRCLKDGRSIHLALPLADVPAIATAAKIRVCRFENQMCGGLRVRDRARRCSQKLLRCAGSLEHIGWCRQWCRNSFLTHLSEAQDKWRSISRSLPLDELDLDDRKGFQHRITPLFRSAPAGSAILHLRRRLDRWPMELLPGYRPNRARHVLQLLEERASPKVQAAYLRTICDGWCSKSRFQLRGGCIFGCGYEKDELKHIARCRVVETLFAGMNLATRRGDYALDVFYCLNLLQASH